MIEINTPLSKAIWSFARWPLAIVLSLLISVLLLFSFIKNGLGNTPVENGHWTTATAIGSEDAGLRLRALVAIAGLLASTREDSMYYTLKSMNGQPLRINCSYRITGTNYDANWWSITAYGWDYYLIPNTQKRYSFNNENIERSDDGSWVIDVSAEELSGNWLPIGLSGSAPKDKASDLEFDLLLRLYTPGDAYLSTPESAPLPKVSLEECV